MNLRAFRRKRQQRNSSAIRFAARMWRKIFLIFTNIFTSKVNRRCISVRAIAWNIINAIFNMLTVARTGSQPEHNSSPGGTTEWP